MTRMPDEYYKTLELELNEVFAELIETISSSRDIAYIREFIDVGEYGLALETICGVVTANNYIIPQSSYQKIVELAQRMEIDKNFFENIKSIEA